MKLIADGGSTKTAWTLVDAQKQTVGEYRTEGYNPYFWDTEQIKASMQEQLISKIDALAVNEVFFYGAGCSTPEKNAIVQRAFDPCFPNARVHIEHDLLASARALLKREKGFAAILGTGTNTCLYDGYTITHNIDSLGYLLGDEGSGSYIGRKLVRDFMRHYFPEDLQKAFAEKFGYTDNEQIFNDLYHKPFPNRTLAGFCGFAGEHAGNEYIRAIVRESFEDFFKNLVSRYPKYQEYKFNCVGSVGYSFKDILIDIAENRYGMKAATMLRSPINALVEFHNEHL